MAPARHHVRLVCFDWGGVILRICRSWAQGCEHAGLDLRGDLGPRPFANERKGHAEHFQLGRLTPDEFFRRVSETMGGLYSPDEVERVHHAWLIGEYPGAGQLIDDLHAAGHATALLSNTNHAHWVRQQPSTDSAGRPLPHFPAAAALTHRLASHTLGLAKPDPKIYESLERATGLHPHQILFFDDLPENTAAAADRGWLTFTVDHTGDTASEMRAHLRGLGLLP